MHPGPPTRRANDTCCDCTPAAAALMAAYPDRSHRTSHKRIDQVFMELPTVAVFVLHNHLQQFVYHCNCALHHSPAPTCNARSRRRTASGDHV